MCREGYKLIQIMTIYKDTKAIRQIRLAYQGAPVYIGVIKITKNECMRFGGNAVEGSALGVVYIQCIAIFHCMHIVS